MFVLDSHCDTPSQILRGRDLAKDNALAHVDFPKIKRGGVDGAFFALYIPAALEGEQAYEYAQRLYDCVCDTLKSNPDKAALAVSELQAYENKDKGLFSIFLGLENGSPIGRSLERLHEFYDKGVRYMTLCHTRDNEICDSCASSVKTWHGLSPFGREVVAEMNRMGMLIDVSHISDEAFYDVLECSTRPVVATHSCCRALSDHPRNMTDDMIRALAAKGGVIQINFYPLFLDASFGKVLDESGLMDKGDPIEAAFIADPFDERKRAEWFEILSELKKLERPSYKLIADHIDHVVDLVGIDYVGLGSDFDGICVAPDGLEDMSMFQVVFEELRRRGYSEEDLEKIASRNFFNVFSSSGEGRS
jgi:membrane dipeptidase